MLLFFLIQFDLYLINIKNTFKCKIFFERLVIIFIKIPVLQGIETHFCIKLRFDIDDFNWSKENKTTIDY